MDSTIFPTHAIDSPAHAFKDVVTGQSRTQGVPTPGGLNVRQNIDSLVNENGEVQKGMTPGFDFASDQKPGG